MMRLFLLTLSMIFAFTSSSSSSLGSDAYFKIHVVDEDTGRGVPLVELETVNNVRYVTDSNGFVALAEPGLWGEKVFFTVRSHGYQFANDGFGYAGKALDVEQGGSAVLKIKRLNIAQRLYRMTGADIYRDSVLLGENVPIEKPLLNAKVFGSDSVVNTIYQGKIHWFWGDTNKPSYPLGNFDVPGAVSDLPTSGGLDPDAGVNLTYFVGDNEFARPTAKMPGDGPTWIDGLVTVDAPGGREQMFAAFVKIKPPLTAYGRGLAKWNDSTQNFEKVADFDLHAIVQPGGHPVKYGQGQEEYVYFSKPAPLVRVRATPDSITQLSHYEAFTCLLEGSTVDSPKIDRDASGTARYSWKRNAPALTSEMQKKLIDAGHLREGEGLLALRDSGSGKTVLAHGGSVYWNEHRQRWVMIFLEHFGSRSFLGEVWYAEADSLVGPWVYAKKIVTHDRYDFYNPKQHPMFDADGGRTIYFEGTYTNTFSGNPTKTPRYEYNQVMYKLELDDPRLALPVAIYRDNAGVLRQRNDQESNRPEQIAFFALDREVEQAIPIYVSSDGSQLSTASEHGSGNGEPLFYGLPSDTEDRPEAVQPLYEFVDPATSERVYSTKATAPREGFERQAKPLCYVWPSPLRYTWEVDAQ